MLGERADRSFSRFGACQELSCNLFPTVTSVQKRDLTVPCMGDSWGNHLPWDGSESQACRIPGKAMLGAVFWAHRELLPHCFDIRVERVGGHYAS